MDCLSLLQDAASDFGDALSPFEEIPSPACDSLPVMSRLHRSSRFLTLRKNKTDHSGGESAMTSAIAELRVPRPDAKSVLEIKHFESAKLAELDVMQADYRFLDFMVFGALSPASGKRAGSIGQANKRLNADLPSD
jgi:hypothetical protein